MESEDIKAAAKLADDRDGFGVLDKVKKRDLRLLLDPELIDYVRGRVRRGVHDGPGAEVAKRTGNTFGHFGVHVVGAQAVLTMTWLRTAVPPPAVRRAMAAGISLPPGSIRPASWRQWDVEQLIYKLWNHRSAVWERASDRFAHQIMEAWCPNVPWIEEDLDTATEADNTVQFPKQRVFQAFYEPIDAEMATSRRGHLCKWVPAPSLATVFGIVPKPREMPEAVLPFGPEDEEDEMWVHDWNNRPRPITCPRETM